MDDVMAKAGYHGSFKSHMENAIASIQVV
ncbi:uncharacterized protein G2W53_037164 [Senna tora]|uniref:Uncharacterized protein n=1 Tax=Senna tora TaxID=362788 RepID=A0A834SWS4_9FABA|nr:uncharacterized protein G2W53_037164 [Senna tora]